MEERANPLRLGLAWLALAAVYFASAKLGLSMAFVADQVSPVWPPTGIALASIVRFGPRMWPGIALGAFVANLTVNEPVSTAAGIAVGNTAEALVAGALLHGTGFRAALDRQRDAVAFLVLAAGFSCMVAATVGVVSLCATGLHPWGTFRSLWSVWWVGDAVGALVVAPVLLVWSDAASRGAALLAAPGRGLAEAMALTGVLVILLVTVFAGRPETSVAGYPLHYVMFPVVIWSALRFGSRGATAVTFAIAVAAIASTLAGRGPFAGDTPTASLVLLQLFMAVVVVTALTLAAAATERDHAEASRAADYASLRISEERLRLALDAGSMGVWDWNVASGAVRWSDNLEAIHGLAAGSFAGTFQAFQALVHPDDRPLVSGAVQRAVEERSGYDIEFRILRADGTTGWMAGKALVVTDDRGNAARMIGVGMDVTRRRRLEEELTERAQQLAAADRQKDQFLAMLAHELRNPLASLTTALYGMRRDPGRRERFAEIAERQVKQLTRLVDDLLDVSRITQGKIALRLEPVALADVVTRAVETVRPLIDGRGHALEVALPATPITLQADPARLAQVIANLLANAANYTPAGGHIWLTTDRVGSEAVIRVRDDGVGLPREVLPHIFDLFVQGDTSLDRTSGGLGIGLTIVRRLVELHGGRVEAHSGGVGKGSEFVVVLPAEAKAASAPAPATPEVPERSLHILVVEDNPDAGDSLGIVLELWGHTVRVARDAPAALALASAERFDVVLSDIGLPGMDGYALARRLRELPGTPLLIALSGYGSDTDRRRAAEAGFHHHVAKPPEMDALAALLAEAPVVARDRA